MLLSIHSTYSILRFPHLPRYRNGVCKSVSESWIDNNLCQTLSIHRQLLWRYPFRKEMYHLRVRIWFEWTKNGKYLKRPWVEFETECINWLTDTKMMYRCRSYTLGWFPNRYLHTDLLPRYKRAQGILWTSLSGSCDESWLVQSILNANRTFLFLYIRKKQIKSANHGN